MIIKRKEFLQIGSLASASFMMPKFLKAFDRPMMVPPGNKVVVVLQFSGGNDGLNTLIPVRNDIYYKARPGLGILKDRALTLTGDVGLHPALEAFKGLYENGDLAILNSVGYPNPDRSHFRSMDIWHSASNSNAYVNTGWIGRFLDARCPPIPDGTFGRGKGCDKHTTAVEIDDILSLALKGEMNNGLAFRDPRKLYSISNQKYFKDINADHHTGDETIDYLYKTMSETLSSATYIFQQFKLHPTTEAYPGTTLGRDLKTIASLILSDLNTKVYYVSLGSFDTHVNQENQQKRLFTELNDAMKAFISDMKKNGRFDDVLVMTFSEFGRRVTQNASGGTDHGTANNMFFISGGLKEKGLLNEMPDLADLADGDLKHKIDFKQVYATVLNKWLGADDKVILGTDHPHLNFI